MINSSTPRPFGRPSRRQVLRLGAALGITPLLAGRLTSPTRPTGTAGDSDASVAPKDRSPEALSAPTIRGTVDWNDVHQTISGFGGSTAFGMADKVMQFPTARRNEILDSLFSPTTGTGLSIIRLQIPNIKPIQKNGYTFTEDNGQASFVDAAKLRAKQTLMATAWSPPGWMKSNGDENGGGTVLRQYWDDYADYLSEYALRYQNRDTPLTVISPANEPDAATNYPSSIWSGPDLRDFTKNNIAPTFRRRSVKTQYI